jgi:hypothetical protein|tara:strand:+ start:867 stop:1019 length:153 start_codon:yes stop_codon:yes gene_type:complete
MNINQRVAFARAAEEEELQARKKPKAKKGKREGDKKMTPVSRKGKSKFKY